jgi:hypothetical protein
MTFSFYLVRLFIGQSQWSKAWVCGLSLAGIAGSKPTRVMNVSCERYILSGRGLCEGSDHLSRGVLPSVVCLSVIVKARQ